MSSKLKYQRLQTQIIVFAVWGISFNILHIEYVKKKIIIKAPRKFIFKLYDCTEIFLYDTHEHFKKYFYIFVTSNSILKSQRFTLF